VAEATLVDTSVLLDLATDDARWADWSEDRLAAARDRGRVVINPIVYAEVAVGFDSIELLDHALPPEDFEREALPFPAGFLAGKAFVTYRRRGGGKRSPIADFYIGAHASVLGYRVLTRNPAQFRAYFRALDIESPD
jgi:predicted nucleic acid-binding protein